MSLSWAFAELQMAMLLRRLIPPLQGSSASSNSPPSRILQRPYSSCGARQGHCKQCTLVRLARRSTKLQAHAGQRPGQARKHV